MASVNRNPLSDFRAMNVVLTGGGQPSCTSTAIAAATQPPSNNVQPTLVVQDVSVCLAAGTAAHPAVQVSLIDGTSGGTNIVWAGVMSGLANGYSNILQNSLNIPCHSGFATLQFGTSLSTSAVGSVAMGGYYLGGYWN